jgi:hypothetical protein
MRSTAAFGGLNEEYRYSLSRTWDDSLPAVLVVMMNPSTASITHNDPSVAKCCRYAADWGYGSLWVGNSCAYCVFRSMWAGDSIRCGHLILFDVGSYSVVMWAAFAVLP